MSNHINDLLALFQQHSNAQTQDMELHLIGHVIEYDPKTNMCRVYLPTRRAQDEGDNDQPMETGWIQFGSPMVGNKFGFQYCLKGGATAENPEKGEQVQVSIQDRQSGLCAVASLTYNDEMLPPGGGDDESEDDEDNGAESDNEASQKLKPGELIFKHESGSFLKFYENGDIRVGCVGNMYVETKEDCNLTVLEGDLNVEVQQGDAAVIVQEGDVEVNTELGDIAVTADMGDIAIEASTGVVSVAAAEEIDIDAPVVNVLSPVVNIGSGEVQQLANLYHALVTYNTHTHPIEGGPPEPQAEIGIDTTIDTAAS